MADLKDAAAAVRRGDELARGIQRIGDGFFDQDVEAQLHQPASDRGVRDGRSGDDGGVGAAGELIETGEFRAVVSLGGGLGPGRIEIENAGELSLFRLIDHAEVIASERAGSNDGDTWLHYS